MKRLKITNDRGWTPRTLRKQERKIKNVALRQRGHGGSLSHGRLSGKRVAAMLNLCWQSVSFYVSLFNESWLDLLLDRKSPPGREPFLTPEQQNGLRELVLTRTLPVVWNIPSSWSTQILQLYIHEHYEMAMSREGICKLLRRRKLSWPRPTYLHLGQE